MDDETKKELIRATVPSLVVPLTKAAVDHRYQMKRLEKQQEMAVDVAERRKRGMEAMAREKGGATVGPVGRTEPVGSSPGDVYDGLEELKEETDCGFCRDVADKLMDAPPDDARQGLDELRSYVRETERIQNHDINEDEAQEIVRDLIDKWDTVPKYAVNMT